MVFKAVEESLPSYNLEFEKEGKIEKCNKNNRRIVWVEIVRKQKYQPAGQCF